jgi:ribosomal protein S18 acetylase RimI-like enzyme
MSFLIREMQKEDIHDVAQIHLSAFPGFFLSFLGRHFLSELYLSIIQDQSGMAFVCEEKEQLVGFVAGASRLSGFFSRLLCWRWWRFAYSALIPVLKNPLIIPRLLRAIRKPRDVSNHVDTGTLMSLAVVPEMQGCGIGQVLVRAFLEEAARRGLRHIDLMTDKNNNDSVNQFYKRMGFRCLQTFVTPEGRAMNEYVVDI